MTADELRTECRNRNIPRSQGNLVYEIIQVLIEDDKKNRRYDARTAYDDDNDPDGSLERAQVIADADIESNDLQAQEAEATYLEERLKKVKKGIHEAKASIERNKKVRLIPSNARRIKHRQSTQQAARAVQHADATRGPSTPTQPDVHLPAAITPSNGQSPDTVSTTGAAPIIDAPCIFLPASITGAGINAVRDKVANFRPSKVLADQSGYHVTFPDSEEGSKACQACYDYWKSKEFSIFDEVLQLEIRDKR